MTTLPWLLIAGVLVLNLWASALLVRSREYSAGQKAAQLGVIWAIPFIGAIIVWLVIREGSSVTVSADPSETHLQQRQVTWGDYGDHSDGDGVGH
jgi:hypothetical protein